MSDFKLNTDLNKPELAGERVLRTSGGVRGLVASDLPASEVVGTLTKRVRVAKTQTESYEYLAPQLFGKNLFFDGTVDVNYTELHTTTTDNPYADTKITDFNGETNKAVRFTYEAKTQSNVKTKILDSVLMNFKTAPGDAITAIYSQTSNVNKAQSLKWAGQVWTALADRMVSQTVTGSDVAAVGASTNKSISLVLTNYGTTRKGHLGVGTDPVTAPGIIKTAAGDSVEPSMKYSGKDFYLIQSPEFKVNTVYDGEKVFYSWDGVQTEVAGVYTLDFANAEEMPDAVKAKLANAKAILVHKNAVFGVQDWEGSGVASAGKLYTIFHNYMKQDAFPVYDAPVILFETSAAK